MIMLNTLSVPTTRIENVAETFHKIEILDPYRWLEDQNSPETREWIAAQTAYQKQVTDPMPGRESIRKRLTELMRVDSVGMPQEQGGVYFLSKRRAEEDQSKLYMRQGLQGADEVLIDPISISNDPSTSVSRLDTSQDGTLLAYAIRQGGEDEIEVRLFDVLTRKDLDDSLSKGRYGISLMPDKSGFYYSKYENGVGSRVFYHLMGSPNSEDRYVFGEGYAPDKYIDARVSEDGGYLQIIVSYGSAGTRTEVYVQNLKVGGDLKPIVQDIEARFTGEIFGDRLFLETNWEASNGKILKVDLEHPERENWLEIVPERSDAVMEGFSIIGGELYIAYLKNVVSEIKVFSLDGTFVRDLALPGLGSAYGPYGKQSGSEAFYYFTSFTHPTAIFRLDTRSGEQTLFAQSEVPVDPGKFEVKQIFYPSKDGTLIPMFLIHLKGLELDGARPTLLNGYGGFNVSLTPSFSSTAVLWAEQGGVFAIANLRGGGEFGEKWHEAGMFGNKQNVFDDFIAAAEWLQANGYTNSQKLAISGGSNGGLLVGAALTQRPELFQAVQCGVPLLDMLRFQHFLVAQFWVSEYGSSEVLEQFDYLRAYSPYHRVVSGTKYPAVMFVTGDADTRVAPLHARKMTALLQATTSSDRPIILHYDTKSGHSAGKPVKDVINDLVEQQSFLLNQVGA